MKPTLQFRLTQQLALTPQLQQSIRLLQLSTLELNQELEQALSDNPLLERVDDPMQDALRILPSGALVAPGEYRPSEDPGAQASSPDYTAESPSGPTESGASDADSGSSDATDWDPSRADGFDGPGELAGQRRGDEDAEEADFLQMASHGISLKEHLHEQLRALNCSARDRGLVTLLIDEINRDGYLEISTDEVMAMLPAELEIEVSEINAARRLVQSFDPTGVGASNLSECLLLQLESAEISQGHSPELLTVTQNLICNYLPLLANRDYVKLKKALHASDDTLREVQNLIRSLNPKPGARFDSESAGYITPDVWVRRTRSGWQATLNPDVVPKLRINEMYAQILRKNRGANGQLGGQLQEARWLLKNVQQRFDTILRVAQAIVERQRSFFSHGAVAMRPLVLREIADAVGLHESTVSRVTTQKFMLTPYGTFELKYFFGSHVATESGGAASSTAIRELIRQLISEENASTPLSDSRIAELLGEQGIMVARRTVAKYREALKIPAVAQRKAL